MPTRVACVRWSVVWRPATPFHEAGCSCRGLLLQSLHPVQEKSRSRCGLFGARGEGASGNLPRIRFDLAWRRLLRFWRCPLPA